jgi:hypothetical protein
VCPFIILCLYKRIALTLTYSVLYCVPTITLYLLIYRSFTNRIKKHRHLINPSKFSEAILTVSSYIHLIILGSKTNKKDTKENIKIGITLLWLHLKHIQL